MAGSSFEAEFLQTHNAYRRQHAAPPLTINKNLCRSAQAWAEHLLSIKTLKHSNKDYGENLYYAWSSANKKLTGHEAVESWYSEIKDYNFSRPGFSSKTGHFTQVVWKDTNEVGVGLATDGNTTFVVGQYLPAGNITNAGYFEKNVLPAGTKVDSKSTGTTDKVQPVHGASGIHSKQAPSVPRSTEMSAPGGRGEHHVGSSLKDSSFEAEFLQTHNAYRRQHGAPPLTINKNLCRSSQEWAEHLLSIRTLMHSNGEYGENVYYAWSSANKRLTGREAVESWYSEIKDYNFSRPGFSSKTGHFTQVVWKDTNEVGVGLATDGNTTFVVGQYLPAGNISNAGYFERNVLPAGSKVDFKSTPSGESADRVGQALAGLSIKSNQLPSSSHSSGPAPRKSQCPQSSSSEGENLSQFRQSLLEAQNDYRRQHGARPLSMCPILSKEAQDWAAHLISINALKNSSKGYGETMSYKWTSTMVPPTGKEVAESWYKENGKYNFAAPGFQKGTGNFTQMIWGSSEQVGVGLASDGKGKFITVAFYKPPGNITNPGYFQDNVKPAGR
ncbi:ancylostoma secreted protein-like isoform X2 [Cyprinus carpio]|uniref:Ancylostoma secreted protein-like isoform X2 n=1 Tax=Cyprinus carpio TaxID=7962 RepID=A0A9Q9Y247_CYPCA|nr:ancylostoma secreted protein-like isoform X2 [Cyprinus carpio]